LKSVAAGIVMQVTTGAVNVDVVVMFNSGQPTQCTYGGGSVCCGASTTVVDPAPDTDVYVTVVLQ
jgi:hypothetical protein